VPAFQQGVLECGARVGTKRVVVTVDPGGDFERLKTVVHGAHEAVVIFPGV